jgi:hypothetical protein
MSKTRLIGGLFAVIESNHGVLTTLARAPGIQGLRLLGHFNVEPCTPDPCRPTYDLVFSFSRRHSQEENTRPRDLNGFLNVMRERQMSKGG